jgi:hypothetical protein
VSPQPRPRSKDPRPEPEDDEVLTPDAVSGPDGEVVDPGDGLPPQRPDRRPLWALILGLSAVWFTMLGSPLSFLIDPIAVFYGFRTMRRIDEEGGDPRERRKAKIGFVAGVVAMLFVVVQLVLFQLFFEWDKTTDDEDVRFGDEKPTVTTEATGGEPSATTEPEG